MHGRDPAGGSMERVIADVNDRDLVIDCGPYEYGDAAGARDFRPQARART